MKQNDSKKETNKVSRKSSTSAKVSADSGKEPQLTDLTFIELRKLAEKEYQAGKEILDNRFCHTEKEVASALKHMKMAAIMGMSSAQYELAHALIYPFRDRNADYHEGIMWCKEAADGGNNRAQNLLAKIYHHGWYGTKANFDMAMNLYQKAAKQGDAESLLSLGHIYYFGGQNVPQDFSKAIYYYQLADEKCGFEGGLDALAAVNKIGNMYLHGLGVSANGATAAFWFRKNALRGDSSSAFQLAEIHYHGLAGSEVNIQEALKWYEMSAIMVCPCPRAQLQLAKMYESGIGVDRNLKTALKWYKTVYDDTDSLYYDLGQEYEHVLYFVEQKIAELEKQLGETSIEED